MNGMVFFQVCYTQRPSTSQHLKPGCSRAFPYEWYGFLLGLLYSKVLYFSTIKGGV